MRNLMYAIPATLGLLLGGTVAAAQDQIYNDPEVHESQYVPGVYFVSGGIGEGGIAGFQAVEKSYDLKLMFAASSGHYLADVGVKISDAQGNTVIETTTEGPILLADMKPGRYTVEATFEGKTQSRKVTVGSSGLKTYNFFFNTQDI